MRKTCLVAAILAGILPSVLHAESVEIKKTVQTASQDTGVSESKLKSEKDGTSPARNAARAKEGSVHAGKNLTASKNKSAKSSLMQRPPELKPVAPGRNLVQAVRPQSKPDTRQGQSKAAAKETAKPRNVLVL